MDPIPDDVRQLLDSHIDSIEQLEILRVLGEDATREWRDDEIATQTQSTTEMAQTNLFALEARGMLMCVQRDGSVACRFGPHSAELEARIRRLLASYQHRPVTMIRIVYERNANTSGSSSDVFKIKKQH